MAASRIDPLDNPREQSGTCPDPAEFREVLGHFATGIAAITGIDGGAPIGLLVNSFTSVSLDPPLVAFCVSHTSGSWPRMRRTPFHCISFLAANQQEQARRLATSGSDKFRGLTWRPSPCGMPILEGALAWIEGSVEAEYPAGDHVIVVTRVLRLARSERAVDTGPLLYYRGAYEQVIRGGGRDGSSGTRTSPGRVSRPALPIEGEID
jgi:3-hydroxy-9,10-secoandrosta-1,3,5(10)-triene-9,17-dione monooxygenase reductase component